MEEYKTAKQIQEGRYSVARLPDGKSWRCADSLSSITMEWQDGLFNSTVKVRGGSSELDARDMYYYLFDNCIEQLWGF